jgi:3-deoxy-manno-octulosonate cytidylyltransferase (CMP-KDO synthetase)
MKTSIIIPARLASTRLPEKALADIFGKSLVMRVYHQAKKSLLAAEVFIATDHEKIYNHVVSEGGHAIMTSTHHQSGTDRISEVASNLDSDIILNLQGDEPLIHPGQIDDLIKNMQHPEVLIGTQCQKIHDVDMLFDYNVVKVVRDKDNRALYFSRQAIPAIREAGYKHWLGLTDYYRHIGMYGYKRNVLLDITKLPVTSYETTESLEQLRWLQHGYRVHCFETTFSSIGVDTPEDLERVREEVFKEMIR